MNTNDKVTLEEYRQAMTSLKKCFTEGMEILNILENITIVYDGDEYLTEAKELSSGIFWVLTDDRDLNSYEFIFFDIPCDTDGTPTGDHIMELNSKNGHTYNHKNVWETSIKNNSSYRPYNKKAYDYYPRGRVQISNNKADIYLNQNINIPNIINEIKTAFGLSAHNISKVRVVVDNSDHYQCWMDRE